MGSDQLPLGMNRVSADVALVGRNADFLIDAGESAQFFDVPVHRLVCVVRQGLIVIERGILVFLQNSLCNVVKFDGYTICRLDGRNLYMTAFYVASAEIIGVRMSESGEATKQEDITDRIQVCLGSRQLKITDTGHLLLGKVDYLFLSCFQCWLE